MFVTHSISEAVLIGSRILLLSAHPGQVKAELASNGRDHVHPLTGAKLSDSIHGLLFGGIGGASEEAGHELV
jgi:NitT/TauT family transport system ATP-binding protein